MTKLSQIPDEAGCLLGHMPEYRSLALQQAVAELCESRWRELRGHEPGESLAHALWSTMPPLAELFADLYSSGDPRLDQALHGHRPAWGMALLALGEIARGNADGARLAHEPMMVFESERIGAQYAARMADLLHGRLKIPRLHKHEHRLPLWLALGLIATTTGRCDLDAVLATIRLLADPATSDPMLKEMRHTLDELGIRFLGIEDDRVAYTQHGHEHKPATLNQLGDALFEMRQALLG